MATTALSIGSNGHSHVAEDAFNCALFRMLPEPLQEHSRQRPYLWFYLHDLPVEEVVIPDYAPSLGRTEQELSRPNLVYPSAKGIFVHILPDAEDARDFYMAIEPDRIPNLSGLAEQVDAILVDYVDVLKAATDSNRRAEVLVEILDEICEVDGDERGGWYRRLFKRRRRNRLQGTAQELMGLKYVVLRDKLGVGTLEPMIVDPYIEDVSCSGVGPLFVEHKIFGGLKSNISFSDGAELDRFVIRLSQKIGRPVTFREPIADAVLPDGSRVNIVFGEDVSKRGSNFTIRKFSATPMSILDLVETGSLNYEMAAYLSFVLRDGLNIFVCGETASGKTTMKNALTTFVSPTAKIVSIEDTPEVQLPHPNWTREVIRGATKDASSEAVTMMDLLKAALRQRPNQIIIGEIRGEEGAVAFQAMQTGHACMATFHASSVEKLIQRLTGNPINIPKTYIDTLNVVAICSSVALPDGKPVRRVTSLNEIVRYDTATDSFQYVEIFRWNPFTDTHEFVGFQNSYLLEQIIAPKMGHTS